MRLVLKGRKCFVAGLLQFVLKPSVSMVTFTPTSSEIFLEENLFMHTYGSLCGQHTHIHANYTLAHISTQDKRNV